jgi:hypothetical protein
LTKEVDEFLSHFGVKGMKWGVRRASGSGSSALHPDAVRINEHRARVKKGGTDALSTEELQRLVTRMNLEKQYSSLQPPSAGKRTGKFLADLLVNVGKQQASKAVNDQVSKRITKMLVSR